MLHLPDEFPAEIPAVNSSIPPVSCSRDQVIITFFLFSDKHKHSPLIKEYMISFTPDTHLWHIIQILKFKQHLRNKLRDEFGLEKKKSNCSDVCEGQTLCLL